MRLKVIQGKLIYNNLMQETCANPRPISWYRTSIDSKVFKSLHEKSDWRAAIQTFGYLGALLLTGGAAMYASWHFPLGVTLLLTLLYGMVASFMMNAVHELGHGTVFKTKFLNAFFVRVFAFLSLNNFEMFGESHARHHRYTLHEPDDLEVVLPQKMIFRHVLIYGIFNFPYRLGIG